jgi:hypothetical protein
LVLYQIQESVCLVSPAATTPALAIPPYGEAQHITQYAASSCAWCNYLRKMNGSVVQKQQA